MHAQLAQDTQPTPTSGATIFVVDDDAAVRHSLTRLLGSAGWATEAFASAGDFLERAPITASGCVLLDVNMPGMTGLELQARMAEAGNAMPVVFITGKGDIPMTVQAMKHGAVDFLVKPVAEDVLFQALEHAVRRQMAEAVNRQQRDNILARLARLSDREREVLEQVIKGRLNKQIAYELGIVEKTVKVHRGRVMEKMEANTIAELVHLYDRAGIGFSRPAD